MQATSQNLNVSFNVNGRQYTARRLKPSQAIALATRLAKILGPGIGKALPKKGEKPNPAVLLEALAPHMDEGPILSFIHDMLGVVAYENTFLIGDKFERHFESNLPDLFPILAEVVPFQFGGFFEGLLSGKGETEAHAQA